MRLQLYDPTRKHSYVSDAYYAPMLAYARDHGIDLQRTDSLLPTSGCGMICDADYLSPDVIIHFKQNDCPIFAFNCIDSAYLSEMLRFNPYLPLVNRIFMLSGVPNRNYSHATVIDSEFNITTEKRQYLPDKDWQVFDFLRERGALQSLPYIIWNNLPIPARKPFAEKRATVLFRGGGHFLRIVAFLVALKNGCADPASGFLLRDYFNDSMPTQFRYCDECRAIFKQFNRYPMDVGTGDECQSVAEWGDELDLSNPGLWNNRCPKSFLWLAEQFQKKHGPIDMQALCNALNFQSEPEPRHRETVRDVRFFADCKWEFSIYAAQRFWEAASVGTVNLLPARANDQDYFPPMYDGEHYWTFGDDLESVDSHITTEEQYQAVADNANALWEKWIKPGKYVLSENLLRHIFDLIQTPRDT